MMLTWITNCKIEIVKFKSETAKLQFDIFTINFMHCKTGQHRSSVTVQLQFNISIVDIIFHAHIKLETNTLDMVLKGNERKRQRHMKAPDISTDKQTDYKTEKHKTQYANSEHEQSMYMWNDRLDNFCCLYFYSFHKINGMHRTAIRQREK
jgi:hypothetical protein